MRHDITTDNTSVNKRQLGAFITLLIILSAFFLIKKQSFPIFLMIFDIETAVRFILNKINYKKQTK